MFGSSAFTEQFFPALVFTILVYTQHPKPKRFSQCNEWADTAIGVGVWVDPHFSDSLLNHFAGEERVFTFLHCFKHAVEHPYTTELIRWLRHCDYRGISDGRPFSSLLLGNPSEPRLNVFGDEFLPLLHFSKNASVHVLLHFNEDATQRLESLRIVYREANAERFH